MANSEIKDQQHIRQIIWGFLIFVWLFRFYQGLLLHQLNGAPFITVKADNVFWIYHALQIPYHSIHNYALGLFLDLSWLIICLYGIWKLYHRIAALLIVLLFVNYLIIYNSVATHHEHKLVALLFLNLLLSIKSCKNFVLVFAAIRYYTIFTLFSAALWKFSRGSFFIMEQMSEILKHQHIEYLITYPNSYFNTFITYLITHPQYAIIFWYSGWVVELSFVIGFFSRRFDKILGALFLSFFLMDYILMHLCFAEFCIFALVFYPWKEIWSYYELELK